eukprot:624232-Amphidinium_carterae.1
MLELESESAHQRNEQNQELNEKRCSKEFQKGEILKECQHVEEVEEKCVDRLQSEQLENHEQGEGELDFPKTVDLEACERSEQLENHEQGEGELDFPKTVDLEA